MNLGLRILGPLALAALVWTLMPSQGGLRAGMTLFALVGALWMTQGLPLAVTALSVPLLAAFSGLLSPGQALASFAHPVIFLFLGGFAMAAALSRQELDRALATFVLRLARGRVLGAVLLLAALCALLSMWVSNTATVALMLPLALGLLRSGGEGEVGVREKTFVLLALAYSASIGGIGTLVGSPPNAIAAAQAGIGFAEWMRMGLPLVVVLWPLMLLVLALVLRPRLQGRITLEHEPPLVWTRERMITAVIFLLTVSAWIASAPLAHLLGVRSDMDTLIALSALVALAATRIIGWDDLERHTRWGVLLLFGGGLALSEVMSRSGASAFLAQLLLDGVSQIPTVWLILGVLLFVVLLTEFVSNTASAALLLPIFLSVAASMGMPAVSVAAAIAMAASCAFMLPVATPPNAIVFSTNEVPQSAMMRCGLWLNLMCVLVIGAMAAWVWP